MLALTRPINIAIPRGSEVAMRLDPLKNKLIRKLEAALFPVFIP
jgi:hypothetical protein